MGSAPAEGTATVTVWPIWRFAHSDSGNVHHKRAEPMRHSCPLDSSAGRQHQSRRISPTSRADAELQPPDDVAVEPECDAHRLGGAGHAAEPR